MNILVIGSEGTIGKPLVKKLSENHRVFCADIVKQSRPNYYMADITDYESLSKCFLKACPDIVFHLAGEVSRETCEIWPVKAMQTNVVGALNVIKLCSKHYAKLVYASTSEACGELCNSDRYIEESAIPLKHQGIYGLSKYQAEMLIWHYQERQLLENPVILRYFMSYGPGEMSSAYRSAMSRWIIAALLNKPLVVHKDTRRQWTYIDDTVDGTICAGLQAENGTYHIGTQEDYLSEKIAEIIIEMTNSQSWILRKECPPNIYPVKLGSFEKMKCVLGWTAKTDIRTGIKKTIEWTENNMHLYSQDQDI